MPTADEIVAYARTWLGAPWRHQGRGTGASRAIDCAGLLVVTAQHFNLPGIDLTGYRRDPGVQFRRQINKFTTPCNDKTKWHGAIAIFSDSVQPCHTGIMAVDPVTGEVTCIHSEAAPARRCHEEGLFASSPSLRSRLLSVRHFMETDYV